MPTHDPNDPMDKKNNEPGYETSDANVGGVVTFIVVLASSLAVFFVVCFGMGKLINQALIRHDGPLTHWNQVAGVQQANMASNPVIEQQQLRDMVSKFPTPRLQTDDGNQDIAQMHTREDLLLNHYTWVDEKAQTVRIPIARAMQILAAQGLPVSEQPAQSGQPGQGQAGQAQAAQRQAVQMPAMVGDAETAIALPLTNGFARTGPELKMMEERQQRMGLDAESSQAPVQ